MTLRVGELIEILKQYPESHRVFAGRRVDEVFEKFRKTLDEVHRGDIKEIDFLFDCPSPEERERTCPGDAGLAGGYIESLNKKNKTAIKILF